MKRRICAVLYEYIFAKTLDKFVFCVMLKKNKQKGKKMKNQNKLYAMILMLLLAGCKNKQNGKTDYNYELSYPKSVDTVYVIRTLDQGNASGNGASKYVAATDKNANDYHMRFNLNNAMTIKSNNRDHILSFISPGDTLVMDGNWVIKNLTFEHEKAKYYTKGK